MANGNKIQRIPRIPENTKTVISVLFPYYLGEEFYKNSNVSRYAVSADYHIITGRIINDIAEALRRRFPESSFEAFVDNSPFPEVRAAALAGLGKLGRQGLLINKTTTEAQQKWVWRPKYWGYIQLPSPQINKIVR